MKIHRYTQTIFFKLAPVRCRHSKKDLLDYWIKIILITGLTAAAVSMVLYPRLAKADLVNPEGPKVNKEVIVAYLPLPENEDIWVREYADKYGKTLSERNHIRELLHCLLYNEAGYGSNKGHGDGGLAGGPLQFHQATWDGYRKLMKKEPGSRYDMEQAIETAAWALSTGRGQAWGPILRGYCQ